MVADSGSTEALRPAIGIALLVTFFVILAAVFVVRPTTTVSGHLTLEIDVRPIQFSPLNPLESVLLSWHTFHMR